MKKHLKLIMLALFATLSLSLTSCGDDDDEPKYGNGASSEVAFNLNGKDYYWEGDLYDMGDWYDPSYSWGSISVSNFASNHSYVYATATAYSRKLKDSDDLHYGTDFNTASLEFTFKNFNWKTAQKGQILEFDIEYRASDSMWWGCQIGLNTPHSNLEQTYAWYGNNGVKGTAKFVSYSNDVVIIEFSNVTMTNADFYSSGSVGNTNIPNTLTLNGSVPFVVE